MFLDLATEELVAGHSRENKSEYDGTCMRLCVRTRRASDRRKCVEAWQGECASEPARAPSVIVLSSSSPRCLPDAAHLRPGIRRSRVHSPSAARRKHNWPTIRKSAESKSRQSEYPPMFRDDNIRLGIKVKRVHSPGAPKEPA